MADIADKDRYADLTDKQQAVVDEISADPTAQNTEIADRADVSRSTVTNVKEHYGEIVERQIHRHADEVTSNDDNGFATLNELREPTPQTIDERPQQPESEAEAEADGGATALQVGLDRETVWDVLAGNDPSAVQERVADAVFRQAFDES